MKKKTIYSLISSLIYIAAVMLVWTLVGSLVSNEFIVPSVFSTVRSMLKIFYVSEFYMAYFNTLLHAAIGFALSFTVGVALAIAGSVSEKIRYLLSPLVSTVRLIPTMAIALMLYLWVSEDIAPALVAFIVVMPTVYAQILSVLTGVDGKLLEMARAYRVKACRTIRYVYLPLCSSAVADCAATSLALTLKLTVAAEVLVGALQSLGGIMYYAKNIYLDASLVFAVTVWTVITGIILQWLIRGVYLATKGLIKRFRLKQTGSRFSVKEQAFTQKSEGLNIKGVTIRYGEELAIDGVSLKIEPSEKLAIMGRSGSGKTTLLKAIAGLVDYEGTIAGDKNTAMVFQTDRLIPPLTLRENLFVTSPDSDIDEIIEKIGLKEHKNKRADELSGGMARRVAFARAFTKNCPCILADEPFTGLDISTKHGIIDAVKPMLESKTFILVTHDLYEAYALCDRIAVLENGKIVKIIEKTDQNREKTEKFLESL